MRQFLTVMRQFRTRTRFRPSPEIDTRARRLDRSVLAGTAFDLSERTAVTASATIADTAFDDGEQSGNRSSGTYQRTFADAGSFPYHCTIHGTATSGMRGSVTVTAPAGGEGDDGNTGGNDGGGGPGGSPY